MIELLEVSKAFGALKVLDRISLLIPEGGKICFVGKSGSGKSVTTKIILGLLKQDRGEVRFNGVSTATFSKKDWDVLLEDFGVVFQGAALFDSLTILENVGIKLYENRKYSNSKIRELVKEALLRVDLKPNVLERYPSELSGGMRKRVAVSRAIIHEPRFLIYDEPSTGLDPVSSAVIDEMINDLSKDGRTSIIITHDMSTVREVADRVIMLHEANKHFDGPTAEFLASHDPHIRAFLDR